MRLKTIKLAGFKSFVDPTTIPFLSSLTAIVGPNGCGKSNIVDAIRWVIGESSAKQLRGQALTDVIFNGTATRKPLGHASIELVFDNRDGSLGGAYAKYSEISIRREINRDGQSHYAFNGSRCRRRDILDVFLGTGLGPRSYAVIEQGMISQLIEAKPEDLRIHVEEAAGISKYKERRRETENRMRHTRDNLERLNDLREELAKQLSHLKRQANAAQRYKTLKQEQRLKKVQLQVLHWQNLEHNVQSLTARIQEQENQLEAKIAELRNLNAEAEKRREQQHEYNEQYNATQERYYQLGADISRLEQSIKNAQERQQQQLSDLEQIENTFNEITADLSSDRTQIETLQAEVTQIEPKLEQVRNTADSSNSQLLATEQEFTHWQQHWDEFNSNAAKTAQQAEVERTRIQQLEQRIAANQEQISRIEEQRGKLDSDHVQEEIALLSKQCDDHKAHFEQQNAHNTQLDQRIAKQREQVSELRKTLDDTSDQLRTLQGQCTSLEALQQAALGKSDNVIMDWLVDHNLDKLPRFAEEIQVEKGWERAVEVVLDLYLNAVCVPDLEPLIEKLEDFNTGELSFVIAQSGDKTQATRLAKNVTLASKIHGKTLSTHLNHVYVAETTQQALMLLPDLAAHESVVTRDGIWLGTDWLKITKLSNEKSGIIEREQELLQIRNNIAEYCNRVAECECRFEEAKVDLTRLEQEREQQQEKTHNLSASYSEVRTQLGVKQARLEQIQQQQTAMCMELEAHQQQLACVKQQHVTANAAKEEALVQIAIDEKQRLKLIQQRENYMEKLEHLKQQTRTDKQQADELNLRYTAIQQQLNLLKQNIAREEKQLTDLRQRRHSLSQSLTENEQPLQNLKRELESALEQHLVVEGEVSETKQRLENVEHSLREINKKRIMIEEQIDANRNDLEQVKMECQALEIRKQGHQQQIIENNYEIQQVINEMPEGADVTNWEELIAKLEARIQRLGPINLAAIDEHEKLTQRKQYLDAQNEDLLEALATLENAIHKIDRETRVRFKETFDNVNTNFMEIFPRIFGGGKAYLELTSDNMLETGIIVKAQPLGKRNTTIHLLSGGEKALTTIALVFSLFQLNPAPFCILDEVDAPLDDLNVSRFCQLVKDMSDKIQFMFITHNKITMEMAKQLTGVTMNEPGVSRMVSVDIEAAVAMATS